MRLSEFVPHGSLKKLCVSYLTKHITNNHATSLALPKQLVWGWQRRGNFQFIYLVDVSL